MFKMTASSRCGIVLIMLMGCSDSPMPIVDRIGRSNLYVVNTAYENLAVEFVENNTDSSKAVFVNLNDTAFVDAGYHIGGWARPSIIISNFTLIANQATQPDTVLTEPVVTDSSWVTSEGSTWEESHWYFITPAR